MAHKPRRVPSPSAAARRRALSVQFLRRGLFSTGTSFPSPPLAPTLLFRRFSSPPPLPIALAPTSAGLNRNMVGSGRALRDTAPYTSTCSPANSGSASRERFPPEAAPLFAGCDHRRWLSVVDKARWRRSYEAADD
ncbi:hypothetical protein NL676_021324 [Syzygium grande]|nr:hypothetical protein NL676_021324 [Syzygium grande]